VARTKKSNVNHSSDRWDIGEAKGEMRSGYSISDSNAKGAKQGLGNPHAWLRIVHWVG
jgi:hypothetical protein